MNIWRGISENWAIPAPRLSPAAAKRAAAWIPTTLRSSSSTRPCPMSSATSWVPTPWKRPTQASSFWPRPAPRSRSRINCRISACLCWPSRSPAHSSGSPCRSRPAATSAWPCCGPRTQSCWTKSPSCGWWTAQSAI